ncbi:nucleoplasmin-like protein isoform X2 [Periplaneta americana]|uniref:nucleoplasmin-like protein isoform X2 n=1 Tax=Periplaneta americana TaxID=6978 RepID=UPI0037E733D2
MVEYLFWGATLTEKNHTATWEVDLGGSVVNKLEYLVVKQVFLGENVKDNELQVVQVEVNVMKPTVMPLALLEKGSVEQVNLDVKFTETPVQFKLLKGCGPVHLIGNHVFNFQKIVRQKTESDPEECEDEEEAVEEEVELKVDNEEEAEEESEEDESYEPEAESDEDEGNGAPEKPAVSKRKRKAEKPQKFQNQHHMFWFHYGSTVPKYRKF